MSAGPATLACPAVCCRGTLAEAITGGRFINPTTNQLDHVWVLLTLLDLALGLEYLHCVCSIVHGDLKVRREVRRGRVPPKLGPAWCTACTGVLRAEHLVGLHTLVHSPPCRMPACMDA